MNKIFTVSSNQLLDRFTHEKEPIGFSQQDAFTCLYDAYADRIYRYIYLRVANDKLAEDITADVFLEVWEKLPTYQTGKSPIISWLYGIAHNAIISQGLNQGTLIEFDQPSPVEINRDDNIPLELHIEAQEHHAALKELADKQQQVLILKFICGFGAFEAAPQLENQQGTIFSLQIPGLEGGPDEYPALPLI